MGVNVEVREVVEQKLKGSGADDPDSIVERARCRSDFRLSRWGGFTYI